MEREQDIKKEIARYFKYNYTKKETIGHLTRDGYSADEIAVALAEKDFDALDEKNSDHILIYPTIVMLAIVTMAFASVFSTAENTSVRTLFVTLALFSSLTIIGYWYKNTFAILMVSVIFLGFLIWVLYSTYVISATYEEWHYPFRLAVLIGSMLSLLAIGNLRFYFRQKNKR